MPYARLSLPPPVGLHPRLFYGMRQNCYGRVHYTMNREIVYPIERFYIIQYEKRRRQRQKFIRLPENIEPIYMTTDIEKSLLIVLEKEGELDGYINFYDVTTFNIKRTIALPEDVHWNDILHMKLSLNSRNLILLTTAPEQRVFMITLDMQATTYSGIIESGKATNFACNALDFNLIVVCGFEECFLMCKVDKELHISSRIKCKGMSFTTCGFLAPDVILLGTNDNRLVVAETGEVKFQMRANVATHLDTLWEQEVLDEILREKFLHEYDLMHKEIRCINVYERGFLFAISNKVIVFDRVSKFAFERRTVHTIPIEYYPPETYQIEFVDVDAEEKHIIIVTKHAQIYTAPIIIPGIARAKHNPVRPLGLLVHNDNVIDMAICSWKTIVMTASLDKTVRIWNYDSDEMELVHKFQAAISVIALSPSGLMAVIGFPDQLRLAQIFLDELNIIKTFNFALVKCVRFAAHGHFIAAAFENRIALCCVKTLKVARMLKGHSGEVLTLEWTRDDKFLMSGGAEGAIYQWDVEKGVRVVELVQKGMVYPTVATTWSYPMKIYAGTSTGIVREFANENLSREVTPSRNRVPITGIAMAHSNLMMFISNELGELVNVQLPFNEAGGGTITHHRYFTGRINKILFSTENTMLFVISETGTFAIFAVTNTTDRLFPIERDLLRSQEVLVTRKTFHLKVAAIAGLETRLKQQKFEFEYQLSQNAIFDGQHLAMVHKYFCDKLEQLKKTNNRLEEEHIVTMNGLIFKLKDKKRRHVERVENLIELFKDRTVMEYEKMEMLRRAMSELTEASDRVLKKAAGVLQDTVEALETHYKREQDSRKEMLRELMREVQEQQVEFLAYCRQSERDDKFMMSQLQCSYADEINKHREESLWWRGTTGVTRKQSYTLTYRINATSVEIDKLESELVKKHKICAKLASIVDERIKELQDRDYIISTKEMRIMDLMFENQDLDKNKMVLSHQVAVLKSHIEPHENQITKCRHRARDIERALAAINASNLVLEVKVVNEREKYLEIVEILRDKRVEATKAREEHYGIITDIYNMSVHISELEKLKAAIQTLFERYANTFRLKYQLTLDELVENEFLKQRHYVDTVCDSWRDRKDNRSLDGKYRRLRRENKMIRQEIVNLRADRLKLISINAWKLTHPKTKQRNDRQKQLAITLRKINRLLGGEESDEVKQVLEKAKQQLQLQDQVTDEVTEQVIKDVIEQVTEQANEQVPQVLQGEDKAREAL